MRKKTISKLFAILMVTSLLFTTGGCVRTHSYGGGIYTGEWKDGVPNGYGKFTYSEDVIYEGEWKDGKLHGQGTSPPGMMARNLKVNGNTASWMVMGPRQIKETPMWANSKKA